MQNRSNRGSGKPVWVRVHYQPALMIGTRPKRIALGPAAHRPQQQAGHMTALDQFAAKIHLAKTEPSTHDPKRTFHSYLDIQVGRPIRGVAEVNISWAKADNLVSWREPWAMILN